MTIGIYCLKFNGTDKVYIGQSTNIEKRFTKHKYNFKKGTAANKLQEAYNLYGAPFIETILEISTLELDCAEKEAIEIYDSINKGFNTYKDAYQSPNPQLGYLNGNAKYSKEQIFQAFNLLIDSTHTVKEISTIVGIPEHVIYRIADGTTHIWLKEENHLRYMELMKLKGHRNYSTRGKEVVKNTCKYKGIYNPPVISPSGEVYHIDNISNFAKQHNLDNAALHRVLRGNSKTHKGWKLWAQPGPV